MSSHALLTRVKASSYVLSLTLQQSEVASNWANLPIASQRAVPEIGQPSQGAPRPDSLVKAMYCRHTDLCLQAVANLACACCRYERAGRVKGESQRFGRALVQRHVALPGDIANQEGRGVLVRPRSRLHRSLHCCRLSCRGCTVCVECWAPLPACLRRQHSFCNGPRQCPCPEWLSTLQL